MLAFLERSASRCYTGSLTDLLQILGEFRQTSEAWPRSAKGLGAALRRLAPALRMRGCECKALPKRGASSVGISRSAPIRPRPMLKLRPALSGWSSYNRCRRRQPPLRFIEPPQDMQDMQDMVFRGHYCRRHMSGQPPPPRRCITGGAIYLPPVLFVHGIPELPTENGDTTPAGCWLLSKPHTTPDGGHDNDAPQRRRQRETARETRDGALAGAAPITRYVFSDNYGA
jgi:hypothetical protein